MHTPACAAAAVSVTSACGLLHYSCEVANVTVLLTSLLKPPAAVLPCHVAYRLYSWADCCNSLQQGTVQEGTTIKGIDTTFLTSSQDGAFTVTLGDLYAEEQKDLIIKLTVSKSVSIASTLCLPLAH